MAVQGAGKRSVKAYIKKTKNENSNLEGLSFGARVNRKGEAGIGAIFKFHSLSSPLRGT